MARYQPLPADGCHVHPHCLTCPLPACIYDTLAVRQQLYADRNQEIARLRDAGIGIAEIRERFGLSKREIWRILARAKVRA